MVHSTTGIEFASSMQGIIYFMMNI